MKTGYKSVYFSPEETGCRCGKCDNLQGMPEESLIKADLLREMCGFPLMMSSGYRCPLHPQNPQGPHSEGAFDISVSHMRAYFVLKNAILLGFSGIGVSQKGEHRFIHLDDCKDSAERPRPSVWSY